MILLVFQMNGHLLTHIASFRISKKRTSLNASGYYRSFQYPVTYNLIGSDCYSVIQVSSLNYNMKKPHRPIPQDPIGSFKLLSVLRNSTLVMRR